MATLCQVVGVFSSLLFATILASPEAPEVSYYEKAPYPPESPVFTHYTPPAPYPTLPLTPPPQFAYAAPAFFERSRYSYIPAFFHSTSYPHFEHTPPPLQTSYPIPAGKPVHEQSPPPPVMSYPFIAGGRVHAHAPAYLPAPRMDRVFAGFVSPLSESGPAIPRTVYGLPNLRK